AYQAQPLPHLSYKRLTCSVATTVTVAMATTVATTPATVAMATTVATPAITMATPATSTVVIGTPATVVIGGSLSAWVTTHATMKSAITSRVGKHNAVRWQPFAGSTQRFQLKAMFGSGPRLQPR